MLDPKPALAESLLDGPLPSSRRSRGTVLAVVAFFLGAACAVTKSYISSIGAWGLQHPYVKKSAVMLGSFSLSTQRPSQPLPVIASRLDRSLSSASAGLVTVGGRRLPSGLITSSRSSVVSQRPCQRVSCKGTVSEKQSIDDDVGYNLLFESAMEEFDGMTVKATQPFPTYVKGDFVIPSLGQFEMGERKFVGFLDPFGKMQRFRIDGDTVHATYRMMSTGFRNNSLEASTIGAGLLFFETEPPRKNPWYLGPVNNMPPFAPNDNTFVNTIRLGKNLVSLTDSYTMLDIDPESLNVIGDHPFEDNLKGLVCYTGSAHPKRNPHSGAWIDFIGNANLFGKKTTIRLFELGDKEPNNRRSIYDLEMPSAPYIHDFAVTEKNIILPRMPVQFSATEVATKPMAAAFQTIDEQENGDNGFYIVPLDGSQHAVRALPPESPLFYAHVVNAYENASGIVVDLTTTPQNPFASDLTVQGARSKDQRNKGAAGGKNLVKRFFLPFNTKAPVTTEVISDPQTATDFPKVNPNYQSRLYRYYWANEWFAASPHNSYSSMAVAKYDVDDVGKKLTWSRKHWYPSEATMVPSDKDGAEEDEGVLLFTALDGTTGSTYLICVDSKTMETVSEVGPFPRIAFTTHGNFYPTS